MMPILHYAGAYGFTSMDCWTSVPPGTVSEQYLDKHNMLDNGESAFAAILMECDENKDSSSYQSCRRRRTYCMYFIKYINQLY